jgi:hydrogenase maturation protease
MRTIVVGVGNPILGDDGVGIHVVRAVREKLPKGVVGEEAATGGMNLLDLITGYERAILIDAVVVNDMKIGEVCMLDSTEMASAHSMNPHDVTFAEALEVGRKMGTEGIPTDIVIIGINIEPVTDFSEELSSPVTAAVEKAKDMVIELLRSK